MCDYNNGANKTLSPLPLIIVYSLSNWFSPLVCSMLHRNAICIIKREGVMYYLGWREGVIYFLLRGTSIYMTILTAGEYGLDFSEPSLLILQNDGFWVGFFILFFFFFVLSLAENQGFARFEGKSPKMVERRPCEQRKWKHSSPTRSRTCRVADKHEMSG